MQRLVAALRTTRRTHSIRSPILRHHFSGCGAPQCSTRLCASGAVNAGTKVGAPVPSLDAASKMNLSSAASAMRPAAAASAPKPNTAPSYSSSIGSPSANASLAYVSSVLASRVPGHSLPAAAYLDESVYQADLALLWNRGWLFAGYTMQLPKAGDYFTYEIGADSIIVMRSADGDINSGNNAGRIQAFHNTCRHRGSRIVTETQETQHTHRLVCPYHRWAYERNGTLVHARDMGANFVKSENSLHEIHVEEVEGLLFICMTPKTEKPMFDFAPARALIGPQLAPHGLARGSKIAFTAHYAIEANWKMVYENNRECYHCAGSHPEYVKSNYDLHLTYNKKDDGTFERDLDPLFPGKDRVLAYINAKTAEWEKLGFACSPSSSFPGEGWYRASRMPLHEGWVTESLDGAPVSTLMGSLPQRDMGSFRIHTLPNFWMHLSGDHGCSTRLTPTGPHTTAARVDWIVDANAVEGRDYTLDRLLPIWTKTSEQDWHLCKINMQGVASSAYTPGMLSERKEAGLDRFIAWYIHTMQRGIKDALRQQSPLN